MAMIAIEGEIRYATFIYLARTAENLTNGEIGAGRELPEEGGSGSVRRKGISRRRDRLPEIGRDIGEDPQISRIPVARDDWPTSRLEALPIKSAWQLAAKGGYRLLGVGRDRRTRPAIRPLVTKFDVSI